MSNRAVLCIGLGFWAIGGLVFAQAPAKDKIPARRQESAGRSRTTPIIRSMVIRQARVR